ncbi:PIN domain-containing protein [Paramicrobacterium humi]|uniref:Ribonuclease VapC n=1 Tax=Paramicrobacterium humi TaxID=640635 RepID=A0A1H4L4Y4_9MICO|nr:type II toxin-antitoxin system VapC family toxin [Microbacterium humi]SEB65763.1 PIN domain-containing protein [Microbacterium humi]
MPTSADLLLDTSAAIALIVENSDFHEPVIQRTHGLILGLSGHASFETYSVLTRLPITLRLSSAAASRVIATNFPGTHHLGAEATNSALGILAAANIAGGAVYDGLVGLAAKAAGIPLLSCDRRAERTYTALSVETELI